MVDCIAFPREALLAPVIATGRGGSGTRLLSSILHDMGIFLGNSLNVSMDSTEWVDSIYTISVDLLSSAPPEISATARQRILLETAYGILQEGMASGAWHIGRPWGWKLPETMLMMPEVFSTFTHARLIHLVRHPVHACLRRTHMTSRANNPVGSAVLAEAYRSMGWNPLQVHAHEPHIHNAVSWLYQVKRMVEFGRNELTPDRYMEIKYEDICHNVAFCSKNIANFLNLEVEIHAASFDVDAGRIQQWRGPDTRIDEVWEICGAMATRLGYEPISGNDRL